MIHTRKAIHFTFTLVAVALCSIAPASAQTPPPPPYPLGQLPMGMSVTWPTAPRITRSVDVRTLADFNTAASVAGTLITVAAPISGQGTISASDIEVHIADGSSLGGVFINKSTKRIALIGGTYTGMIEVALPSIFWPSRVDNPAWVVEDVMINGIHLRSTTNALYLRGHRVALVRSFAYSVDYTVWSDTITNDQTSDLIVAGNNLQSEGRQATVRVWNVRNAVFVENRMTDTLVSGSKHNFRVHGTSDQVFAARNELVNAGAMFGGFSDDNVGRLYFNSNTFHHKTPDLFNPSQATVHILRARDNVAYTDVWTCFYCLRPPWMWSLVNNVVHPYTDPPPPPAGMPVQ